MLVMASLNYDLKERLDNFTDSVMLSSLCKSIASEIASGSMKLFTFVETLGFYTTSQNVLIREKGVTVLSSVLSQLPHNYLNESELHFITMFYCDRLRNRDKVISSMLNGILAIVNMSYLSQDSLLFLLRSIFEHIQCQSQLVQERYNMYLILKTLIENRLDDLKPMGSDLVDGIISTIDGERDPNNLMLLFTMLPCIIKEFPLDHLTEEMFAVVACYFPVDFNSSGREDLSLTREHLVEKLAPCLYATSDFANYCIPVIIEKLYSTHRIAKLDSLNLLCDSVQTFGALKLQQYLCDLWAALRKELMSVKDVEITDAALEAIISLIRVISTNKISCKDFVDKIIADTKSSLCNVQLSLYKPAEKLLETIATISKEICIQVVLAVIPICIGQYSTNISWDDKIELIETLNSVMKICFDHGFCIHDIPELRWTNISQMYLDGLTVENIKLRSKLFLGLVIQRSYLNETQRSILYNAIYDQIETGCDKIQTVCHTTILEFAVLYPQEITLLLKKKFLLNTDKMTVDLLKRKIRTLLAIAKLRELGCMILPEIVTMLTNSINIDIWMTKALIMRGVGKSQDLLKNLIHLLNHDQVGQYVSQQYQVLVSNHEDVLIKENFCDIKFLYKQRIFEYLLQQNSNFVNSTRQNYLIALVYLLKAIPKELKFLHLAELVPLLIESLSLNDMQLVLWTLRSLKFLINTKHDILSNNVQCIIPRLLQLTMKEIMHVRIAALECLVHYTNYPTVLIYPYKWLVLDNLGITIDDRKRLVRKVAVEARTRWFIVGVSEESKNE